ncbi:quinolinate synthase [candidate division WOR-3 bacterium]|uniref:Quinolinate synthase n=1 Tax=candidate division WOR-3 bacterium TaxID=2052148 RepID=A0A660SHI5_UNCW3|nr:MAG: quinolinate synthase [candidate division WOR-3 bacterium]
MREEIEQLKRERDAIILAHNYQPPEIQDIADFVGDSLDLARKGAATPHRTIVFCGVRFMAESAKILAPEKTVLLPVLDAGCPLADMVDGEKLAQLRKRYPHATLLCYVNTTAETKARCDYCCTSANAAAVAAAIPNGRIIFIPDENLARWVMKNTDKEIIPYPGYCYVHKKIKREYLERLKKHYPDAEVLIHPEADPEVQELADFILSTSGMVKRVRDSQKKRFIIGTEEGLIYRLKKENPGKEFFPAGPGLICIDMKKIRLEDVHNALKELVYPIEPESEIMTRARVALNRMVEIGRRDG